MNTNTFIDLLFDRAKQAGFEASEIYLSRGSSFQTAVNKGEITRYSVSESLNLGFRGLHEGKMGCASTQVLDEDAAEMLVASAKAGAELCESEDEEFIFEGSESYPEVNGSYPALTALSSAEKIAMTRALEEKALSFDSHIASCSHCALFSGSRDVRMVNSRGLDLYAHRDHLGAYVFPIARRGDQTGTAGRQALVNDPARLDLDKLAREAAAEAIAFLDAQSIPSGSMRVLLRPDAAADLLETFCGVFSADSAQKGLSLLKGREGEEIASACVNLVDDPLLPDGYASHAFDGEGVAARRNMIVSEGRLNTLLHNLKTARKQGVQTTGNAARASVAGPMTVAPSNFHFMPSARSREEMYLDAGNALLVTDLMGLHSGANSVSGDFSLGAKGFLIRNGKIDRPVNQITIAGNFFELLRNMEAVGSDLEFGAGCFASPTLMVRSLSVAGK